jgi:hypothetical protein
MIIDPHKQLRDATWHYLSADTAAYAEMSFGELMQFAAGRFWPTDRQRRLLALRMHLQ